jgi:APA family basic amino acid/polyamine antiporter
VLVFCAFILITLFFVGSFQKILEYVMFFDSISLITAAAAIFILRKRKTGEEGAVFRVKGYPFVPALYILIYGAVNLSVLIANPTAFSYGALLFLLGYPLFFLLRRLIQRG